MHFLSKRQGGVASFAAPKGVGCEITDAEVWGPLAAGEAAACQARVTAGYSIGRLSSACRGGTKVGVAGINIP